MHVENYKSIYVCVNRVASQSIRNNLLPYVLEEDDAELLGYSELMAKYQKSVMSKSFVFSFVRNPYDRLVSIYFGLVKDNVELLQKYGINTFERFVREALESRVSGLFDYILPQSRLLRSETERKEKSSVDYIGRFETIQRDFKTACDAKAIPHRWLKIENKSNHFNFRYYYNDETKRKVRKFYEEDFDSFKYTFKNRL